MRSIAHSLSTHLYAINAVQRCAFFIYPFLRNIRGLLCINHASVLTRIATPLLRALSPTQFCSLMCILHAHISKKWAWFNMHPYICNKFGTIMPYSSLHPVIRDLRVSLCINCVSNLRQAMNAVQCLYTQCTTIPIGCTRFIVHQEPCINALAQ